MERKGESQGASEASKGKRGGCLFPRVPTVFFRSPTFSPFWPTESLEQDKWSLVFTSWSKCSHLLLINVVNQVLIKTFLWWICTCECFPCSKRLRTRPMFIPLQKQYVSSPLLFRMFFPCFLDCRSVSRTYLLFPAQHWDLIDKSSVFLHAAGYHKRLLCFFASSFTSFVGA